MKKTAAMAIAVLFLGALGLVRVESVTQTDGAQRAKPAEAQRVAGERQRCGNVCPLSDVPIYVPPNRGSALSRLGGGTRGGLTL